MSLKNATILAILGASLSVVLGVLSVLALYSNPLAGLVCAGHGAFFGVLRAFVSASYLTFFIVLSSKQK